MMREEEEEGSTGASSVLLVAFATSLALAGCKSDVDKRAAPPAAPAPSATAQAATPATEKAPPVTGPIFADPPAVTTSEASAEPRCTKLEDLHMYAYGWRPEQTKRVVRVARDDTLALRERPSPAAPVVARLPHDQAGIVPTKQVCEVESSRWFEVRVAGKTGWVNRKYIAHATGISTSQFAQHYAKRAGGHPAKTPWEVVNRIVQDMNTPPQEEGHYQAEVLDMQVAGSTATSTVYACCELDDSVQGEQALLTLVHANDGWRLSRADVRWLCYRGVSDDGLCI